MSTPSKPISGPVVASPAATGTCTSPACKRFATARARAALNGVTLYRSDARDGPIVVFAEFRGVVRPVRDVNDLEGLLL